MLTWNSKLELGVDVLDAQHRRIVALANEFAEALRGGAAPEDLEASLRGLAAYSAEHFRLEEQLMAQSAYAGHDLHQEQHRELLGQLERIARRARQQRFREHARKTIGFLRTWVIRHIELSDRDLARHLAARRPGDPLLLLARGNS